MISIIIPTYNRKDLLERAVASALAQTEADTEILIMDDGSDDGTREAWEGRTDGKVRYCRLEHGGACRARNRGLAEAKGEYAAFLDSDDAWEPDKLARQTAFLKETGADIVFCSFRHWDTAGNMTVRPGEKFARGRIEKRQLLAENAVSTQTILGKTACLRAVGFDERFPRMQDWDFALRMAERFAVYYDPTPMADVYLQKDSISGDPVKALKAVRMLYEKNRADYVKDFPATRALMTAYYVYGSAAGENCAGDCLRMRDAGRSLKENAYILLRGTWLGLKGAIRKRGR